MGLKLIGVMEAAAAPVSRAADKENNNTERGGEEGEKGEEGEEGEVSAPAAEM